MEQPEERGLFRGNVSEYNDANVTSFQRPAKGAPTGSVELDLSMQRIRALQALQISAPQVTALDLNGNFIPTLHPHAFDAFRLETLNLGANELKEFPIFPSLTGLRSLCLNSNKLTHLGADFRALSQLEDLQARKNKVEVLDFGILGSSSASLRYLSLACNCLTTIAAPAGLVFPKLVFLGLFGNRLQDAHALVDQLSRLAPNLEKLILSGNRFVADRDYRLMVTAAWPKLQWLDWQYVTEQERQAASQVAGRKRKATA